MPWMPSASLYVIPMPGLSQRRDVLAGRMTDVTPHITEFEGGNALSDFRTQQLLPRLQAIHPQVNALSARFVHLVATDHALAGPERERVAALLTYGDPAAP